MAVGDLGRCVSRVGYKVLWRCIGWASGVVGAVDCWLSGSGGRSSAQVVIAQTLRDAVPERALQIAADVGRGCSGCASGVVGAVDC